MKSLLIILTMILVLSLTVNAEKEAELKDIQIIKEAENSNDPVLKQKAENLKAEIAREEQAKLQKQIESQQSEDEFQKLAKILGVESDTLGTFIITGVVVILVLVAHLGFMRLKKASF